MFDVVWLLEVGRKIAGADARAGSDDDLCDVALALSELQSLIAAGKAHVLAELEARGVTDREDGLTTASWLAREAGLPKGVARREVKVAAKLRALPEVDEALSDGRINAAHALVVVDACNPRVADAVVGLQGTFLGLIEGASFEQWRAEVRDLVAVLDSDGAYDPNEDLARNRLNVAETIDGLVHLTGQLVGEHGMTVKQLIDSKADELFRRYTADHEQCADIAVPERATLRALALVELCRAGVAVDVHATRPPRPEVTLVVKARRPAATASPSGVRLQDGTTRTLLCDPEIHAVIVDGLGRPLDLGRTTRLASPDQRRALAVRDGGCIFPGCDTRVSWCDAHHVEHFEHGGRTDIANLALLCRRHHGVTHRKGWQMQAAGDGWFAWISPSGRTLWSQQHGRRRAGPTP